MKFKQWLAEEMIKSRKGFSPYPYNKNTYHVDRSSSIEFQGADLPKDDDIGRWKFSDGDWEHIHDGKFKKAIKGAVKSHKNAKGSSFSNTLKVKRDE